MVVRSQIWLTPFIVGMLLPAGAQAQVVTDGSTGTQVTGTPHFTITNGTQVGGNLFHSFSQFSIPTGGSAVFNHALTVQNIISRVTGGNLSTIDGVIQANGTANVFLLNPAGLFFGPNARLQLGGSFVGTTASSLNFADGTEFSAIAPHSPPMLTLSVPVGLQFGSQPAPITVQGVGHQLQSSAFAPIRLNAASGLQVTPGHTLALVGGGLQVQGGVLTAPDGAIVLGSVAESGRVNLLPTAQGWTLAGGADHGLGPIELRQRSLLDVSGLGQGTILVQGRDVRLEDGSLLFSQNRGPASSGSLRVIASQSLTLTNRFAPLTIPASGILSENVGSGAAASIFLTTRQLHLQDGAQINVRSFGPATQAPTLDITAFDTLQQTGFFPGRNQAITAVNFGAGVGGNITLATRYLLIQDGGTVGTLSYGPSGSGDVRITATDRMELRGESPVGQVSQVTAGTLGSGAGGQVTIQTRQLSVRDGARLDSSALAAGDAGNVIIHAAELVEVRGQGTLRASEISSAAIRALPAFRRSLKTLPEVPSGASGNVLIQTARLEVDDGGAIAVANEGTGKGGDIQIRARSIRLDHQGSIAASTQTGEGGNIELIAQDYLVLRRGSFISTTAAGTGNGGNITIQSPFVVAVSTENSDIIANAFQGRGGNIQITTQGILGLQFRPFLTPISDITASSQFGVSGTVTITTPDLDLSVNAVKLPTSLLDPTQQIAQGCDTYKNSRFVATGRGGLPENPRQRLTGRHPWTDVRAVAQVGTGTVVTVAPAEHAATLVEATHWRRTATGEIELVAGDGDSQNTTNARVACGFAPRFDRPPVSPFSTNLD